MFRHAASVSLALPHAALPRLALVAMLPLVAALPLTAFPASALERTSVRLGDLAEHESWARSSTGTIRYYNNCTGWVWVWPVYRGDYGMGEVFDAGPGGSLTTSWVLTYNGAGSCGYGYYGTISVHDVDANDCPVDPPLASRYICFPPNSGDWQGTNWGGLNVPSRFAMVLTTNNITYGYVASDHPGAGATGPIACGTCFPTTRETSSYYWGLPSLDCPGEKLFDGFCDAELLIDVTVVQPTSLQTKSWGRIKDLYR
ncbi:MAG TPA: hypothetical protein VKU85_07080 [bacterium]|nr:hypothetical protein [bacterium]